MKILDKYVGAVIIKSVFMVISVFFALIFIFTYLNEVDDIGRNAYGLFQSFLYVLMLMPIKLYRLFPMICLLGVLLGMGRLSERFELTVMRSAGLSIQSILWMVVKALIFLFVIMFVAGEIVGPTSNDYANRFKTASITNGQVLRTKKGSWLKEGLDFIYIRSVLPSGLLIGITRYHFGSRHDLRSVSNAKRGRFINNHWVFKNIKESSFREGKVTNKYYLKKAWKINFNPNILRYFDQKPEEKSLIQLYNQLMYQYHSGGGTQTIPFEFWKRVLQPISLILLVFICVPFIFGSLREIGVGFRVVLGVLAGFAFYTLNDFFGPMSLVYQIPAFFAASIPLFLFALLYFVLVRYCRVN